MKYEYIGPNLITDEGEQPANCYGVAKCMKGDTVELDGRLADKADKNPNYRKITKSKAKPKAKKEPNFSEGVSEDQLKLTD